MQLTRLLENPGTVLADFNGLGAMAMLRRHKLDSAVAVLVVVPISKRCDPLGSMDFACEWFARVIGPICRRAEKRFGVGVVIRHPGP